VRLSAAKKAEAGWLLNSAPDTVTAAAYYLFTHFQHDIGAYPRRFVYEKRNKKTLVDISTSSRAQVAGAHVRTSFYLKTFYPKLCNGRVNCRELFLSRFGWSARPAIRKENTLFESSSRRVVDCSDKVASPTRPIAPQMCASRKHKLGDMIPLG
jgi:hypothetical protein